MKPRYTDKYRFKGGRYTRACETDIRKTFERIREQQKLEKANAKEAKTKVIATIKPKKEAKA